MTPIPAKQPRKISFKEMATMNDSAKIKELRALVEELQAKNRQLREELSNVTHEWEIETELKCSAAFENDLLVKENRQLLEQINILPDLWEGIEDTRKK